MQDVKQACHARGKVEAGPGQHLVKYGVLDRSEAV